MIVPGLLLLLLGCEDDPSADKDLARLERMEQEIRDYIAVAPCSDSTVCAVVALGAKPCGGPWGYLVYSQATVDSAVLAEMAREYTEFNDLLNRRWGWVSTCDLARHPQVACRDGACVDTLHLYDDGIPP